MENFTERKSPAGLYSPQFEHDNCGIGAVVDIKGRKSHKTIDDALQIVEHLEHRAGKDAEGKTGDGVGILTQISDKFFQKVAAELGLTLGAEREYGIGMFFFPQDELKRNQAKKLFEIVCKKEGLPFLGWREVPTCPEVLGHKAIACMPSIWQGFVGKPQRMEPGIAFDRRLYVVRRVFEQSSPDSSTPICRTPTMNPPSAWCTAVSPPTRPPAGTAPTPTASFCTTAKSTPSAATWIPCWPARRPSAPAI